MRSKNATGFKGGMGDTAFSRASKKSNEEPNPLDGTADNFMGTDKFKQTLGHTFDGEDIIPPLLPLNEQVIPDTWVNIPSCLVKGFKADIENQIYLEKMLHATNDSIDKLR